MRIVTDFRHHVRCRKCWTRRVLPRHPDEYVRLPKCKGCGSNKHYFVDKWMMRRNTKAMSCGCDGYHFRHRRGSKYCEYRKDGTRRHYGDPDFHDQRYDYEHPEEAYEDA